MDCADWLMLMDCADWLMLMDCADWLMLMYIVHNFLTFLHDLKSVYLLHCFVIQILVELLAALALK